MSRAREGIAQTKATSVAPSQSEGKVRQKTGFQSVRPLEYRGDLKYRPEGSNIRFSKKKMVSVAVDKMALPDFVHYIFSDIFAVNYVLDSRVEGKRQPVTLNLKNKISEYQLFEMVENVLHQQGLSIFLKGGIYYIWQQKGHKQIALGIGNSIRDIPTVTGQVQQIVPVKYVNVQNLSEFLPRLPEIKALPSLNNNILVVTGKRDQVVQALRFIEMLDRPAMRGRYIGMIDLTY